MRKKIKLATGACGQWVKTSGKGPKPAILIVHGWKSSDPLREEGSTAKLQVRLAEMGYHSLAIALRGHKGSPGDINKVSAIEHTADIREAYEWLANQKTVNFTAIGAYGSSYGAYLLITFVPRASFRWLAVRVPALYPNKIFSTAHATTIVDDTEGLLAWREKHHTAWDCLGLATMSSFKGDLIVFSSGSDEYMPQEMTREIVGAANKAKSVETIIVEGAGHTLTNEQFATFQYQLTDWFKRHQIQQSHS